MNWQDNKLEMMIVGFMGVAMFALMSLTGKLKVTKLFSSEINYSMPRPESHAVNEFSLEGRQVNRSSIAANVASKKPDLKTKQDDKKNDKTKKAAVVATAKTAKKTEIKKPTVKVDVVERTDDQDYGTFAMASLAPFRQVQNQAKKSLSDTLKDDKKAEEGETLSEAEWKALLSTQPSKENFARLLKAVQENKTSEVFAYTLMEELYKTQQETTQENIIATISGLTSASAFTFSVKMASVSQGRNSEALTAYTESYVQKGKLGALNQVLAQGQDAEVVMKALDLVSESLNNVEQTENVYAGRDGRTAPTTTGADYRVLSSSLKRLAASQESEVSRVATQVLEQIGVKTNSSEAVATLPGQTL